jgi:metallo-beta-lactamase family protein
MRLKFLGAAKIVTGACYLLESKDSKILIDCGLFQGKDKKKNFEKFPFEPKEIDFVLVTHAHLDHIGRLPKLAKEGFSGKIFSTKPTKEFANLVLSHSLEIEEEKFFEKKDVKRLFNLWQTVDYGRKIKILPSLSFRFREAGHILGSAIIEIWQKENKKTKKIVFSGDLGNAPAPLLKAPSNIKEADYLIVESAYGDRIHEDKKERREILEDIIEKTISQKGVLMIPIFALERTHQLLYELNYLVENKKIPKIPIFVDNPLSIKMLPIYKKYQNYFNKKTISLLKAGDDPFKFANLFFTKSKKESKKINSLLPPKIIIAGSGMSTGGRILHHEIRYLPKENNFILFTCYQVKGTLGREILDGKKEVEIFGKKIPVKAKVKAIGGYSNHADQEAILSWIKKIKDSQLKVERISPLKIKISQKLKKIFLVQGEERTAKILAQKIKDHLGIEAVVPNLRETFEL